MSKSVTALVAEIAELAIARHPDLPRSMYIERCEPQRLALDIGWKVPEELTALYCTATLMTEPWHAIMFNPPCQISSDCINSNKHLRMYSPPMKVQSGVNAPVVFGDKLIPFAYHDDSLYCVDMNPDLTTGGTPNQIVNVSLRKGIAKVVFPNLAAFLGDGLKKMKREMKREQAAEARASSAPPVTAGQLTDVGAMLADPLAYLKQFHSKLSGVAAWPSTVPPPKVWSAAQRRQRADELIEANPQRTDVQRACARMVEFYAGDAAFDDALRQTALPMTSAKRAKLERALGIAMPQEICELLDAHQFIAAPWDNVAFVGVDVGIAKQCKQLDAINVPADGWSLWPGTVTPTFGKGLLPLNSDDPIICYDFQPGPGGTVGQLVEISFEARSCKVVASSLLEFFVQGLDKLKNRGASVE